MNPLVTIVTSGRRSVNPTQNAIRDVDRARHSYQQHRQSPTTTSCCPVETMAVADGMSLMSSDNKTYDAAPIAKYAFGSLESTFEAAVGLGARPSVRRNGVRMRLPNEKARMP